MKEKIEELVKSLLVDDSFFIVDINIGGVDSFKRVSVLIDSDTGVSIEDCARISRKLGEEIEELNLIDGAYHLEVSSPGVDRPLKLQRQYSKNIGRQLSVMLKDLNIKTGVLEAVDDSGITLLAEEQDKANKKKKNIIKAIIPFTEIKKSNVIVSFK